MLEGYHSVFLKNRSWKPSIHKGFFGLFNPGIIKALYKQPKSNVIVHGWAYSTNIITIIFGKLLGHTICLRTETPLNQELKKNKIITACKHLYLRFLFLFIDRFLFIGKQNKLFYQSLGVKENRLIFTPYAVDNDRFRNSSGAISAEAAKEKVKLPLNKKIILYSGKYISKKRPMDLLKAFHESAAENALLVLLGDGELRYEMEAYIKAHKLQTKVILTGFINQSEIPVYYKAADVFVMCSGLGETWGLSVNEAMNFGLPVIVSDTCGCAYDLVIDKVNGAVFETGNIAQLGSLLTEYLDLPAERKTIAAVNSVKKVDEYSYNRIIDSIEYLQ